MARLSFGVPKHHLRLLHMKIIPRCGLFAVNSAYVKYLPDQEGFLRSLQCEIATAAVKLAIMTQTLSEFEPSAQLPTAYLQHVNARSVITCSP
jgi:hypothetical protein